MKLSDVKGARAFDVLLELGETIRPLADDPEVVALFKDRKIPKGMSGNEFGAQWCGKALDVLVTRHKDTFVAIESTINDITPEEYLESVTIGKMVNDASELYVDDAFTALFFSYAQRTEKPSGSASGSTKAKKV